MGGYQQLVRGNPLRGKFRNSFEKPEPFTPGKVEAISFEHAARSTTPSAAATASWCRCRARGSRWSTAIRRSSCAFPKAKPEDFKKATQRVYHAPATPSGLQVMVLPATP